MSDNKILFFTTMHKGGYEKYGHNYIKTITERVLNKNPNINLKVFYQGFEPPKDTHNNIEWLDFDLNLPHHKIWKEEYLKKSTHPEYKVFKRKKVIDKITKKVRIAEWGDPVKDYGIRFSHKAFVIQHVIDQNYDFDYLIWTDADVVFRDHHYENFPKNILGDKFAALQVELDHIRKDSGLRHIESGCVIFDRNHKDLRIFNERYKEIYKMENLNQVPYPFDGYCMFKALKDTNLTFFDWHAHLPKHMKRITDQRDKTFLHPEIKCRFIHNIGNSKNNQLLE